MCRGRSGNASWTGQNFRDHFASAEVDIERWKKQRDEMKVHDEASAAVRVVALKKEKQAKLDALLKAQAELKAKAEALPAEIGDG
jgi:acyl-CoA hydrolase